MKVRQAEFAMVPSWVLRHPGIRGKGPVIATYTVLRMVAYENPDYDWKSLRVIAKTIAPEVGLGDEAVRKHLSVLQRTGVITVGEVLDIPSDEPGEISTQSVTTGKILPGSGEDLTQTPLLLEDKKRDTPDSAFESFWALCPRKEGKGAAERVWKALAENDRVLATAAMPLHAMAWKKKWPDGDKTFIPHPSTWLNQRRWDDEIDATVPRRISAEVPYQIINGVKVTGAAMR